jgi:hypothetical protein
MGNGMRYSAQNSKKYLPCAASLLSFIALVLLLNRTNPLDVGPAGILLVFGLAYIFVASVLCLALVLVLAVLAGFVKVNMGAGKRLYYAVSILAFAPVFLLALNSIGQLELRDLVLVVVFVSVTCFYIVKRG